MGCVFWRVPSVSVVLGSDPTWFHTGPGNGQSQLRATWGFVVSPMICRVLCAPCRIRPPTLVMPISTFILRVDVPFFFNNCSFQQPAVSSRVFSGFPEKKDPWVQHGEATLGIFANSGLRIRGQQSPKNSLRYCNFATLHRDYHHLGRPNKSTFPPALLQWLRREQGR